MRYRHNPTSSAFDVANHLLFILLIVSFIFPFVYIFSVSISGYAEITLNAVKLLPKGELHLNSYRILLMATNIETAYANSVLYAVLTVILTVFFTSAAAFALERQSLPFRKVILVFIVLTMFVPTNMIPSFLVMIGIGLYNTRWAIVLPSCFSAWYIFIMRANIRSTIGSDPERCSLHGRCRGSVCLPAYCPSAHQTHSGDHRAVCRRGELEQLRGPTDLLDRRHEVSVAADPAEDPPGRTGGQIHRVFPEQSAVGSFAGCLSRRMGGSRASSSPSSLRLSF